jgi:hypothetical protein
MISSSFILEVFMIKSLFIFAASLMMAASANAQEFGGLLGVHQTTADTSAAGASIDGRFNFKAGLLTNFGLNDMAKFRTGLLYNQRHVDLKALGQKVAELNFNYLDVPALFQYNVNEMFGLFGGLVVGINVGKEAKATAPGVTVTGGGNVKGLIPLVQVGANVTFDDMIGFDLYYERGLGEYAENLKDFSTFGANFIYWF